MTYCNVGYTWNVGVLKVMIAIRLEKKQGNSHDSLFLGLVLQCFGRTFFDVALTRDRSLHHWVWVLGEEEVAQQYTYDIQAFKGNIK